MRWATGGGRERAQGLRRVSGVGLAAIAAALALLGGASSARTVRRHVRAQSGTSMPAGLVGAHRCNMHWANSSTFPIPGRGLVLSWAPEHSAVASGHAIAVGGHMLGSQTFLPSGERYDTKIFDTSTGQYIKRFGVHYWWAIANAWTVNPLLGEVIADGGGDHVLKVFFADAPGTSLGAIQAASARGRYAVSDGALPAVKAVYGPGSDGIVGVNAWITSLAFSPDGRWLAGTAKDRTLRIWQVTNAVHPEDQFKIVKVFYDPNIGAYLSVRWSPDGTSLATGERRGRVAIFSFDPNRNRWDEDAIAAFFNLGWTEQIPWLAAHATAVNASGAPLVSDVPVWQHTGLGSVWNVRYSPDGRWLAAAGGSKSAVFDLSAAGAGSPLVTAGHGLDFSPDGHWLAVGGGDEHVYVYDATSHPAFDLSDVLQAHTEPVVGAVAWSPDGATLASVAGGPLLGDLVFNQSVQGADDNLRLWTAAESGGVDCAMLGNPGGPGGGGPGGGGPGGGGPGGGGPGGGGPGGGGPGGGGPGGGGPGSGGPGGGDTNLGPYPGFGNATTGGQGHSTFTVSTSADTGAGSFRDALAQAKSAGGGIIRFALTDSDIRPGSPLKVPANTTINAIGSGVTLWGGGEGGGEGILDVFEGNVIIAGLSIRNAVNDGIQVAPKSSPAHSIANIVIDRCSITNSSDGGIDVTGRNGLTVSNITLIRNYIAGSGRICMKRSADGSYHASLCGGGSLFKYGATNGSYYANFFDDNLERAPLVSGSGSPVPVVADLRYNVARGTQSSSMSVRETASANIVGNWFLDAKDGAMVWSGSHAYFDGGNTDQNTGSSAAGRHLAAPMPVPAIPAAFSEADALAAGAAPRDPIDVCYVALAVHTFSSFGAATCDTTP